MNIEMERKELCNCALHRQRGSPNSVAFSLSIPPSPSILRALAFDDACKFSIVHGAYTIVVLVVGHR
jgi:hypothetical protein